MLIYIGCLRLGKFPSGHRKHRYFFIWPYHNQNTVY